MIHTDMLLNPGKEHRIDIRWWLAEGFHTDQTLKNDIRMLEEAGFGAIEFLAMEEPGADSKLYGWGSEEWVHDSGTVITEATKRGMGFSVTSGTNWANANLTCITPDHKAASKELDYVTESLGAGCTRRGAIPQPRLHDAGIHCQELVAVVAAKVRTGNCLWEETAVLTGAVSAGELTWTAPEDGDYLIFYFYLHGTAQIARPSVSVSYTVNYLDPYGAQAVIAYWDANILTDALRKTIRENGRGMLYMDSLELGTFGRGGQLWGYHLLEAFRESRGYELTPYLPFIVKDSGQLVKFFNYHYTMEDTLKLDRIRNDLYQTMTECYGENMLRPMQAWLHSLGMTLRAEVGYGMPFEVSQSGRYVDGVETESLEFASQIDSYRNLAGVAHICGKIFSSETGATRMNYMKGLEFYTQILYTQFAVGISRTVLHGYSSIAGSDASTYWPGHEGMWPIFSERFGSRQPSYRHYRDWTDAMARYQLLIRRGTPKIDLGILRLDYYLNNLLFAESTDDTYAHGIMRGDDALYWRDMSLQHAGYTWDYFAPQLLLDAENTAELFPDGPSYRALVVYQEYMPVAAAKKLLALAKAGLKTVFVNGVTEIIRPENTAKHHRKAASLTPFLGESDGELAEIIAQVKALPGTRETDVQSDTLRCLQELGVFPRAAFTEPNRNILTFMNQTEQETGLFVYNMLYAEKEPMTFTLEIEGGGKPYRIDCWNAELHPLDSKQADGRTRVTLTLNPGEATMLLLDRQAEAGPAADSRVYGKTVPLPRWALTVEDWNEGEKKVISENRGLGIVTEEVYYETAKTLTDAGTVELKPWKDIPAIGKNVSGLGYYTTRVSLPEGWSDRDGAQLCIGSTNGNTAAVYVNGKKARAYDFNRRCVDISELLHGGENEIRVEVSSTLNNRLLSRDYFSMAKDDSLRLSGSASNANDQAPDASEDSLVAFSCQPDYQDYGMTGTVELRSFRK